MDNKGLLVSAIITTHNRINLLKRAIESVLNQTYPNIELIVVDDASNDGTEVYCNNLPLQYIYIAKQESKGGNYARNQGIKAAKGTYIAFLDDDDYWLPDKIDKQVTLIEQYDCELVYGGRIIELITPNGTIYKEDLPKHNLWGDLHKKILYNVCTTTTNILVKRNALFEIGLFDENLNFWQEYELTIRLAQRKPFYFVNEAICVYRVDTQDKKRLTNKYKPWKKAVTYIYKKHNRLYSQLNLIEKIQVYALYLNDASNRCKNSNLIAKHYIYHICWLILILPFKITGKVKNKFFQHTNS